MKALISKEELSSIQVGDLVERAMGGVILSTLKVISVDDYISAEATELQSKEALQKVVDKVKEITGTEITLTDDMVSRVPFWTFHLRTGAEIDEDLGWDGVTKTGSYLTRIIKKKYDEKEESPVV